MLHYTEGPAMPKEMKERMEGQMKTIKEAIKKDRTILLESQHKKMEMEMAPKMRELHEMSRTMFNEGMERHEKGEMEFEEFADDLHRSMLALYRAKNGKKETT